MWLQEELKRVDREKTPWLIVLMHVPIYNSNEAHYMEGESMRAVYESWFVHYKVDVVFAGHVHAYERSVWFLYPYFPVISISNIFSGSNNPFVFIMNEILVFFLPSFQYRISNIHYNVTSGEQYPIPDKSAPVYITVGDGGNQEGLAGR